MKNLEKIARPLEQKNTMFVVRAKPVTLPSVTTAKVVQAVLISSIVIVLWCWVYGRTSLFAWKVPVSYGSDSLLILAFAKAFLDGDIFLVASKWVVHLGAPFVANWNDYPFTEDIIPALIGSLAKLFGLFTAANITLLLAHILAALSFLFVGTELKYRTAFVWAGALLFAFSHFMLTRAFPHIVLSYYWHLPLVLLVSWWCYSKQSIDFSTRRFRIGLLVSVATGLLNPYYTWMYLQFIGFGFLMHFVRRDYTKLKSIAIFAFATVLAFLTTNADTIIHSFLNGRNSEVLDRRLAHLELFGLKIPDMIFPPPYHAWRSWAEYGKNHYLDVTSLNGEIWSTYLGLIPLAGLLFLAGATIYKILLEKTKSISVHAWQVLWVLIFSLVGGLNLVLGAFGLILFRASNRYSIVILAIVLLFIVRQLSRSCPVRLTAPVAMLMTAFGLWDQLPPRVTPEQIRQTSDLVHADQMFSSTLESQVAKGAMIFQLPVVPFPETPPSYGMADYENFRPYLHTTGLRYSYGTDKGRGDADWQQRIASMQAKEMINALQHYGFSAIIVNRKGFQDSGVQLITEFSKSRGKPLADSPDLVAFGLESSTNPVLPAPAPRYGPGWLANEGSHRWSNSTEAEIKFTNSTGKAKPMELHGALITLTPRTVEMTWNGQILERVQLENIYLPGKSLILKINMLPGSNVLKLKTDTPAALPGLGNGDMRKISFGITGFHLGEIDGSF